MASQAPAHTFTFAVRIHKSGPSHSWTWALSAGILHTLRPFKSWRRQARFVGSVSSLFLESRIFSRMPLLTLITFIGGRYSLVWQQKTGNQRFPLFASIWSGRSYNAGGRMSVNCWKSLHFVFQFMYFICERIILLRVWYCAQRLPFEPLNNHPLTGQQRSALYHYYWINCVNMIWK